MRIRTLGGLALDGADFTRPKPLLLLAYLALEGAQERRYLAELFWPEASDRLKSLTVALSQLRQGAPGAVQADRQRVWTRLPCDAAELLERLQNGVADDMLVSDRGPFLAGLHLPGLGVELEEWVFRTRELVVARLHQVRLGLAERDAREGRFAAAATRAEAAIDLVAMGPEPDDLVRLHTLLLAGRSPLAVRVREEVEGYGIALAKTGEAARERLRATDAGAAPATSHALPTRATSFVGRDLELTEIGTLLAQDHGRLVTLVGPGGVGKTRLALQVAHEQRRLNAFADGVCFVPLAPLRSARAIANAVVDALGRPVDPGPAPLDQARAAIEQRALLLVVDGLEHLMEGAQDLQALAAACPNLRLLVTSRERLHVEQERVLMVAGLPYPGPDEVEPEAAQRADAVRLFEQRARRASPGFSARHGELSAVLRICRLVEGLPLGLELAASWVRVMPVAEIADAIEHDLDTLASSARDVPPRHRSLRAAFERSWTLLSPHEQRVLRRLAVFRGGFRREAAGVVAGARIATLASLVDKSMLRPAPRGRFERQSLVYQFSQQKLAEQPQEAVETAARHATYYLHMLRDAREALHGAGQKEALDLIEEERENLRAAFAAVDPATDPDAFSAAIEALTTFFEVRSRLREGVAFLRASAEHVASSDTTAKAAIGHVQVGEARLLRCLGEFDLAIAVAREALDRLRSAGDTRGRRQALQVLGVAALHQGDYGRATQHFEEAIDLVAEQDPPSERGAALANLGLALQLAGDRGAAVTRLREALDAFRRQGDRLREARLLNNLGLLHFEDGDLEQARAAWEQGLALARRAENHRDALALTSNLGMLHAALADHAAAREHDVHALRVARSIGDKGAEAAALTRLALLDLAQGRLEQAQRGVCEAIDQAWRMRETPRVLEYLKVLADVRAARGDAVGALALYALVRQHGAATGAVRDQALEGFERLAHEVPEALVAEVGARAAEADLDVVVPRAVGVAVP